MRNVPAKVREAAAANTLTLPFSIPPKEWFTLRETGALLGLAESTVEKLYDKKELTGHSHNAGAGERQHKRVLRVSLIAYLQRTADYTDESILDAFIAALGCLPPASLLRVAQQANALAFTKSAGGQQ